MATASSLPENRNLESYTLIWLDRSADESRETVAAQQHFRRAINYLKIFKESNECMKYIQSIPQEDHVVMIVSGRLGQEIVPRIHQLRQVTAIYVYCMDKQKNEPWARPFNKIKRIMVNLDELVKKIHDEQIQRQRNKVYQSFPIQILQPPTIDTSFLYTHVLLHCLIETNSSLTDKNDFLSLCKHQYADNEVELKLIDEFEQNYFPSRALWWYTRQSFLYRILEKALQAQDIEILLLLRFFIRDIQRQLTKTKCTSPIRVFCGQMMFNEDLQTVRDHIGSYMIVNSFLLTGAKQQIRTYFSQIEPSDGLQRVLFDIDADPQLENTKPFGTITSQSEHQNEEQTLFMLGSIFRVDNLRQEQDGMWAVKLTLCSEDEPEIKSIWDREQMADPLSFGRIFGALGRVDAAQKYYQHLLKSLPEEHEDMIACTDALGDLEKRKGNYDASLDYFNQALDLRMKILGSDNPDVGDGYCNIGETFRKKNDFKQAFDAFNRAVAIYSKKMNNDHPKIAICFNNMGHVCMDEDKYPKALDYYEKALAIRKKCLPGTHVQLADSYRHVGSAQECMKNLDEALDSYSRALRIYEKSTSPPHFNMGMVQKSMGSICESKKKYQQAHSYYEGALASFRNTSPKKGDKQIVQIQQDIHRVSAHLK